LQKHKKGEIKIRLKAIKNQEEDDDDQVWGGVKFPDIPASNEEKKKIVRIMKPTRRKA
jgi:hypothetical protein